VYRQNLLGPVDPSFGALSGHLKFAVRRHKFNKDSLIRETRLGCRVQILRFGDWSFRFELLGVGFHHVVSYVQVVGASWVQGSGVPGLAFCVPGLEVHHDNIRLCKNG
jgi:hypothetical protein